MMITIFYCTFVWRVCGLYSAFEDRTQFFGWRMPLFYSTQSGQHVLPLYRRQEIREEVE